MKSTKTLVNGLLKIATCRFFLLPLRLNGLVEETLIDADILVFYLQSNAKIKICDLVHYADEQSN